MVHLEGEGAGPTLGNADFGAALGRHLERGVDVVLVTHLSPAEVDAHLGGGASGGGAGGGGAGGGAARGPGRLFAWSGDPARPVEIEAGGPVERPSWPAPGPLEWARGWLAGTGAPSSAVGEGPASLVHEVATLIDHLPDEHGERSWTLEVEGAVPDRERQVESWFTVANGRTGTRGSLEEGGPGSRPALYVAGVFRWAGPDEGGPELLRGPEWTRLRPTVGGRVVTAAEGEVLEHRRILDLRQAVLHRRWRHGLDGGGELRFCSTRFASLADRQVMALHAEVEAGDGSGGGDRSVSLAGPLLPPAGQDGVDWSQDTEGPGGVRLTGRSRPGGAATFLLASSDEGHRMERMVAVGRAPAGGKEEDGPDDALAAAQGLGLAAVQARHRHAWRARWQQADVVVGGDAGAQRALRFALYHLISSGDPESDAASVGARGISGPGYRGHVFWDTEAFVLPFFIWTHPPTARALLAYRHRTLPAARAKATRLGWRGALFAWESADTGDEVTPDSVALPDGSRLPVLTGVQEHHIAADVAWAAWQYWRATADERFLVEMGAELILETARFWASRAVKGPDGRHHIESVIGPDEYHEEVTDNAFTNVLARWNLRTALEMCDVVASLDGAAWEALAGRLDLQAAERRDWQEVAEGLVDGFDPGTLLYEQFAGFSQLEGLRAADLAPRPFGAEMLVGIPRLRGSQVVKQADVVMLAHMLPGEVPVEVALANYRHYEPLTCHGSSLSPAIHAAVAARVGALDDAARYFAMAGAVDLDDRMGNAAQGVHVATMGGLWQAAVLGFGGVRPDDGGEGDGVRIDPHLPPGWESLAFPLWWRGARLHVEVTPDRLDLHLDGPAVVAVGHGPPYRLALGHFTARAGGAGWGDLEAVATA